MACYPKSNDHNQRPTKYLPLNEQHMSSTLSVAIDFGTSNCAVAYSYASDKDNITVINKWQDGCDTHGKIPTAILFDENQHFMEFGNKAIKKYKELVYDGEHKEKYFFNNFKMLLYNEMVSAFL